MVCFLKSNIRRPLLVRGKFDPRYAHMWKSVPARKYIMHAQIICSWARPFLRLDGSHERALRRRKTARSRSTRSAAAHTTVPSSFAAANVTRRPGAAVAPPSQPPSAVVKRAHPAGAAACSPRAALTLSNRAVIVASSIHGSGQRETPHGAATLARPCSMPSPGGVTRDAP